MNKLLYKLGQSRPLFVLIFILFSPLKKRVLCLGIEPGLQDGRCKLIHCSMTAPNEQAVCLKNGPFPASFYLFSSFQYTVDSEQMFNINELLPMTGFEPWTSGIGSNRSTN